MTPKSPGRALVVGGAGFIGRHLVAALVRRGYEVVAVDDLSRHGQKALTAFTNLPGATFLQADMTDPRATAMLPVDVDRVYHLAAIVGVGRVSASPVNVMRVNTLATQYLCDWFTAHAPADARFLYASTSEVYGGGYFTSLGLPVPTPESVPFVISDPRNPRFSYAMSKMWGEMYCGFAAQECDRDFRVVRYHNVYGPAMGYDHVIPQVIQRLLEREDPFTMFGVDETRSFCWIEDAVEATIRVMEAPRANEAAVVHVGSRDEVTIRRVYELLFQLHGWTPSRLLLKESASGSVPRRCPDVSRLAAVTGYVPATPLEFGLEATLRWYREQRLE